MEHEYTISGKIAPKAEQIKNDALPNFIKKIKWVEQDFSHFGFKTNPDDFHYFTLNSEDIDNAELDSACMNLSVILGCKIAICKDHEVYGNANVFNGGSDYSVVDEDCFLWIYDCGQSLVKEKTKFWNEKFNEFQ